MEQKTRQLFAIVTALTLIIATTTQASNVGTTGNPIQSIGNVLAKIFGGIFKTAQADPGANIFELDGNIVTNTATPPPDDWDHIFNDTVAGPCTPQSPLPASAVSGTVPFCDHDDAAPDATYYATGSKDTNPISSGNNPWQCTSISNPTAKDNLLRGFAYAGQSSGKEFFFVGGIREPKTQGAADWGIWFLKDPTVNCSSAGGTTTFTGKHQNGDILITVEFTIGGTVGTINTFHWQGDDATGFLVQDIVGAGVTCIGGPDSGQICGIANGQNPISPAPFPASVVCSDPSTTDCLKVNQFFEVGIDTALFGQNVCFSRMLIDTRSSPSDTATIKDFTLGNFITCKSSTVPTKQAFDANGNELSTIGTQDANGNLIGGTPINGIRAGATITYVITETNTSTGPLDITNVAASDTLFGSLGSPDAGSDTNGDGKLNPGETWKWTRTFTISSANCPVVTNTVTFTGQVPLLGTPAPVEQASVTVKVICPATELTKTATDGSGHQITQIIRGGTITYVITERNTSVGDPALTQIKNVQVTDTLLGSLGSPDASSDTNSNGFLDVGETWKWTRTFTISSANCPVVTNNVAADGAMVLDGSAAPHETATATVNVLCPVVKITEFGYTNTPKVTSPKSGIVSGTTVFTAKLHNFGTDTATVTAILTESNTNVPAGGSVSCTPTNPVSLTEFSLASGADTILTMTCVYDQAGGATISANLVVTYTLGSGPGKASGSPANINFTVQSD